MVLRLYGGYKVLAKIFANKTAHIVARWYRRRVGSSAVFHVFHDQLEYISEKNIRAISFVVANMATSEYSYSVSSSSRATLKKISQTD